MDELIGKFILLFTIIDPIGSVPVFIAVTAGVDSALRKRVALRACAVSAGILIGFVLVGQFLLDAMGIQLAAFRVAGSVILFLFALDMIFGQSKPESEVLDAERARKRALDLAIYPMAIPSIAGPGSILAAMVLTDNKSESIASQATTAVMMLIVISIVFGCMLLADRIQRLIKDVGASIVSRVMGLITAAIAADGVLGGIKEYFAIGAAA
ncbi:MAG: MarC family protein [Phycisphaera sp.]|nr:MAG: MarC family protein [Phycisphaera sp.]